MMVWQETIMAELVTRRLHGERSYKTKDGEIGTNVS